jgi:hypothetical protein
LKQKQRRKGCTQERNKKSKKQFSNPFKHYEKGFFKIFVYNCRVNKPRNPKKPRACPSVEKTEMGNTKKEKGNTKEGEDKRKESEGKHERKRGENVSNIFR